MIGYLLRFIVVLLLIRFVLRAIALFLRGPASRSAGGPSGPPAHPQPAADLVRDQVCGTFVVKDLAVRATIGGREELFCSTACRDKAVLGRAIAS
jgi:hypothetical protein